MWHGGLGSTSVYTAATVDNAPALVAAEMVTGNGMLNPVWEPGNGGPVVFVGTNPVVSHGYGTTLPDPVTYLREPPGLGWADLGARSPPHRDRGPRRPPRARGARLRRRGAGGSRGRRAGRRRRPRGARRLVRSRRPRRVAPGAGAVHPRPGRRHAPMCRSPISRRSSTTCARARAASPCSAAPARRWAVTACWWSGSGGACWFSPARSTGRAGCASTVGRSTASASGRATPRPWRGPPTPARPAPSGRPGARPGPGRRDRGRQRAGARRHRREPGAGVPRARTGAGRARLARRPRRARRGRGRDRGPRHPRAAVHRPARAVRPEHHRGGAAALRDAGHGAGRRPGRRAEAVVVDLRPAGAPSRRSTCSVAPIPTC